MSETKSLLGSPLHGSSSISNEASNPVFVHGAGRLLPSASRWNSIEIDFGSIFPTSSGSFDERSSRFSKSFHFDLVISDKKTLKRFIAISASLTFIALLIFLLVSFLPHKHPNNGSSKNLTLALNQALLFFDAQKSGILHKDNPIDFRRDSGLHDGNWRNIHVDLVGGFYDSGNNVKYAFTTAYTITLLSWSVVEYNKKYSAIGELDHIRSIIKWGTDYLLNVFVSPNSTTNHPAILYSQVGDASIISGVSNDNSCWQRPEDMDYPRPVSICTSSATDLAGEIIAAFSSASLVFKYVDGNYSQHLTSQAEKLYESANGPTKGSYTDVDSCGGLARNFYNSSGYLDELVWGGTWLFLATGNLTYLHNATDIFDTAVQHELPLDIGVLDWNSKLAASAVLLSRIRYFHDLGYPYERALISSSDRTNLLMCSYLYLHQNFSITTGGLILLRPHKTAPLQYAATAAFLAKLYNDYLSSVGNLGGSCTNTESFSLDMLQRFSKSQAEYILGENPMKMSYLVGFEDQYPIHVHHRGASIPNDGNHYSCSTGKAWFFSKDPNPNILTGAMVAGPDNYDKFLDKRDASDYTEPTLAGNAGLVAALIALHEPDSSDEVGGGLDQTGIFTNIQPV